MAAKQTSILGSVSSLLLGEQMDFGSSIKPHLSKARKPLGPLKLLKLYLCQQEIFPSL